MRLACPHCEKPIEVGAGPRETTAVCPHCQGEMTIPAAQPPRTTAPATDAAARAFEQYAAPTAPAPIVVAEGVYRLPNWVGIGVLALGAVVAMAQYDSSYYSGSLFNRFQNDNATGATANAVEHLAQRGWPSVTGGDIMLGGLLVLLFGRLGVLIDHLAALRQQR
jgi:hypothetical protein